MDKELCKIKCTGCGKQVFEFSFSLLKHGQIMHFLCKDCEEWTTARITDSNAIAIFNGRL